MTTAAPSPADLVGLAARVAAVNGDLAAAGQGQPLTPLPPLRLAVAGPAGSGKTTLVRELLGHAAAQLPGMLAEPAPTGAPVEFSAGPLAVTQDLAGGGGRFHSKRAHPAAPDLFADRALWRIRASLEAPVLGDWGVELIDTPGIDGPRGNLTLPVLAELADGRGRAAVLYVVPSRGLAELDLATLETVRGLPVVAVENIRDADIATSRAAFTRQAVERAACGWSLPVALTRLAEHGAEWNTLLLAVALLQAETLGGRGQSLADAAAARQRDLRGACSARLRGLTAAPAAGQLATLLAVADLVAVERAGETLTAADRSLGALAGLAASAPAAGALRPLLAQAAQSAADRYTVEASSNAPGARRPRARSVATKAAPVAAVTELSQALRGYLDRIRSDQALQLTPADGDRLAAIAAQVAEDRLELVFVGQFSSGKSTLINALLGRDLLPARRRPTTATINELVHADQPTLHVRWIEGTALPMPVRLLESTADGPGAGPAGARLPGQHRVHGEEIRALDRWLRSGTVRPAHRDWRVDDGTARRPDVPAAFRDLVRAVTRPDGTLSEYAYTEGSFRPQIRPPFPVSVTIREWAAPPPPVPDGPAADVGAALDVISEDPATSLRIDRVRIGYPHELLRNLTVVDTPGTDAPIPRHRIATESAINQDRQRAVVYCFNGAKAGSAEDTRNLDLLRRVGSAQEERFFYVITQRGLYVKPGRRGELPTADTRKQEQIRAWVRAQLARLDISPRDLYFTEVQGGVPDAEFERLAGALNRFGARAKGPLLRGWVADIERVVRDAADRGRATLRQQGLDAERRKEEAAALRQELTAVQASRDEFATDAERGVPWVRRRASPAGLSAAADFESDVNGLRARDDFSPFTASAQDALTTLNAQARARAESAWSTAVADARTRLLSGPARGREVAFPAITLPGEVYPTAALLHAIESCHWRSGWKRFTGLFDSKGWTQDIADNRQQISKAWEASSKAAAEAVEGAVTSATAIVSAEFARVTEGIAAQAQALSQPPSAAERDRAEAAVTVGAAWLDRLSSLSRRIEEYERGIG